MRAAISPLRLASLAVVAALAGCESSTGPVPSDGPSFSVMDGSPTRQRARYIVGARDSGFDEGFLDEVASRGGELVGILPQIGVAFVESNDPGFRHAMSRARSVQVVIPDVALALDEPMLGEVVVDHGSLPGAAFYDGLTWGIDAVGAPEAWAAGNRGAGVRVAVLDAGIDHDHPDLALNINAGLSRSFVPCSTNGNCDGPVEDWRISPGVYFNHGTHVAGIIGATGALGVTGVAPEAELVVVKVCTEFANACFGSAIINGLVHAADNGADVVNMSLGFLLVLGNDWWMPYCQEELGLSRRECGQLARNFVTTQDDYVLSSIVIYKRVFQYARDRGTTVVVAAGNDAIDADHSKDLWLAFADFTQSIAVSALGPLGWCYDQSTNVDGQAYYTNYGSSVIDVSAPGGNFLGFFLGSPFTDPCSVAVGSVQPAYFYDGIYSTVSGGWTWAQGTSMAAPHATGVAALLIAANGGSMSPSQVEQALKATSHDLGAPGHDALYGAGRVWAGN